MVLRPFGNFRNLEISALPPTQSSFDVSRIPRNVVRTVLVFVLVLWEGIDMKSVEDLDVFKLAHQLALKTYSTTKVFPREETDLKG
jgi:hypothetical protein